MMIRSILQLSKNVIETALEEYMDEQEDDDVWYSFHEFTVVE